MGGKTDIRIDALEARSRQLCTQRQRQEARRGEVENRRTRREELRRKVLVSVVVLARVEQGLLEEAVLKA